MGIPKRCTTADCGRIATRLVFIDEAEPPGWYDYCNGCAVVLNGEPLPAAGAVTDADMDALRACLSLTTAGTENVRAAWAAIEKLERSSARTNPPAAHPTREAS